MQRDELIRELKELYISIPADKMKLFEEILLVINLNSISRVDITKEQINQLFLNFSGNSVLHDWAELKEIIINYIRNNPNKTLATNGRDIVVNTILGEVLYSFTYKKILVLFIFKIGIQFEHFKMVSIFLSYHLYIPNNFMFSTGEQLNRKLLRYYCTFFSKLPKQDYFVIKQTKFFPSPLSRFYILDSIMPNEHPHNYDSLINLKADLVPDLMVEDFFNYQFSQQNKMSYTTCLQNAKLAALN